MRAAAIVARSPAGPLARPTIRIAPPPTATPTDTWVEWTGAAWTSLSVPSVSTLPGPSAGSLGLSLLLGEYENVCQAPRVALSPALFFTLRAPVGEALVRTYSIVNDTVLGGSGPAPQATVQAITMTNTDCGLNNVDQASGGTITVTKYENGFVEGSFDTTFAKGGPAHGTFRIAVCGPSSGTDDGTAKCLL